MPNKIIIVGGLGGSGKSTFAALLSDRLGIPYFCKDNLKEVMGDGYGCGSGEVFSKGSAVTLLLMLHIAERFLRASTPCILESNFKLCDISKIEALLGKYDCSCLSFILGGDYLTLWQRYLTREQSGVRHWVHGKIKSYEEYCSYHHGGGQDLVSLGTTITVDTTNLEDVNYEKLITIAQSFLESN